MRAGFRRDHLRAAHRADIDDVDHPGISNRDVQARPLGIEEDDVRASAQLEPRHAIARGGVERSQSGVVTGAVQPAPRLIASDCERCSSAASW